MTDFKLFYNYSSSYSDIDSILGSTKYSNKAHLNVIFILLIKLTKTLEFK
jgi:hypothetical protein